MKNILVAFLCLGVFNIQAQKKYTSVNTHSHNDYEQEQPFTLAYQHGFGSIEADIWLKDGNIFVAHDAKDIRSSRTLAALYLQPIDSILKVNKSIYPHAQKLQLLIDIKTEALSSLSALIEVLKQYPSIIENKRIIIAVSGNRPDPKKYAEYPSFIYFDGRPTEVYSREALKKVALISEAFYKFSLWKGEGSMREEEKKKMMEVVEASHQMKKPFRFWATPDTKDAWKMLMDIQTDFINTDKIEALSNYITQQ
jgi:alkaline phosphatase